MTVNNNYAQRSTASFASYHNFIEIQLVAQPSRINFEPIMQHTMQAIHCWQRNRAEYALQAKMEAPIGRKTRGQEGYPEHTDYFTEGEKYWLQMLSKLKSRCVTKSLHRLYERLKNLPMKPW